MLFAGDIQRNVYRPTYSDAGNGPPSSGGQPRFGGHFRVYEQPISAGSGSGDSRGIRWFLNLLFAMPCSFQRIPCELGKILRVVLK